MSFRRIIWFGLMIVSAVLFITGFQRVNISNLSFNYIWEEHSILLVNVIVFFVALFSLLLDIRNQKAGKIREQD